MGNFSININAEPAPSYKPSYNKIRQTACATGVTNYPLGIVKISEGAAATANYLLREYTGINSWKTLRISNVVYSSTNKFYLKYNGAKLVPNANPDTILANFNVSSVNANEAIPLLFAAFDNATFSRNETITFDLEFTDTSDNSLGKVNVGIIGLYVECVEQQEKATITKGFPSTSSCQSHLGITVKVPRGSTKYVYAVESDNFCSISGISLPATISSNETFNMYIDGSDSAGFVDTYSRITIYVKASATSSSIQASAGLSRNHTGNQC